MLPSYDDITKKLGEPLWYDGNGVPRYEPFTPGMTDVYATYIAYFRIGCQSCGREFLVTVDYTSMDAIHGPLKHEVTKPTKTGIGFFHYGDPPAHGGCVGDTMNSIPRQVLEFWNHDIGREGISWTRLPEHEVVVKESWAQEEKKVEGGSEK